MSREVEPVGTFSSRRPHATPRAIRLVSGWPDLADSAPTARYAENRSLTEVTSSARPRARDAAPALATAAIRSGDTAWASDLSFAASHRRRSSPARPTAGSVPTDRRLAVSRV